MFQFQTNVYGQDYSSTGDVSNSPSNNHNQNAITREAAYRHSVSTVKPPSQQINEFFSTGFSSPSSPPELSVQPCSSMPADNFSPEWSNSISDIRLTQSEGDWELPETTEKSPRCVSMMQACHQSPSLRTNSSYDTYDFLDSTNSLVPEKKALARPEGDLQEEVEVELNSDGMQVVSFEGGMSVRNRKSRDLTRKEAIRAYKEKQDQIKSKKLSEELLQRDDGECHGTPMVSFTRKNKVQPVQLAKKEETFAGLKDYRGSGSFSKMKYFRSPFAKKEKYDLPGLC